MEQEIGRGVNREVLELAQTIPLFRNERLNISPLSGGMTNANYKVVSGSGTYVLRVGGAGSGALGIIRRNEIECSTIAAGLGIAPAVRFSDPDRGLLVTDFISGETLHEANAKESANLSAIAKLIRRVHEGPEFPGSFSPFQTVKDYAEKAYACGVQFPEELNSALAQLKRIERALAGEKSSVPCHNDLLAANFIKDAGAISIIDWEYAGMGDPFFDLANFSVNQGLDDNECRKFLNEYGATEPHAFERLKLMQCASDLRESLWGFLQSGVSTIDFDYRKYGNDHLQRFLVKCSDPAFENWLEAVSADR